jgi:hypothetical protein
VNQDEMAMVFLPPGTRATYIALRMAQLTDLEFEHGWCPESAFDGFVWERWS